MAAPNPAVQASAISPQGGIQVGESGEFIVNGPTVPSLQELSMGKMLQQQVDRRPEKLAVVSRWQKTSLTYQSLFDTSRDIAQALLMHGVRPTDRVIVLAGNSIEYVQLLFAVAGIGSVFTIINPTFTAEEVVSTVDFIDPKAIFMAERIGYRNNKNLLKELAAKQQRTSLIVQLGTSEKVSSNVLSWDEFRQIEPNGTQPGLHSVDQYWVEENPHAPLCIQFTSGTTGPRKAAIVTHHNVVNNAYLIGSWLSFTTDDILCCSPPLFHCFGLVSGLLAILAHGGTTIIPSDVFNADSSLRACSEDGCTVIHAVPTMFQAMLDHSKTQALPLRLRLRTGIIAGASLSEILIQRLCDEFGLRGLAYAFGMTELSCVSFMTNPAKVCLLDDRSSVGTPLPHTSVKVVDSDLKTVPPGTRGELLVSGYLVFSEYYKNPQKTEEAIVKDAQGRRWLRTGDLVTLSDSGACVIVGRVKDMIKKGGENIAPADIEKVLEQHPDIAAAAVIGIPDTRWGETIGAYIQRGQNAQSELNAKDIKIWLRNRIAPHKIPDHVFWIGEEAGVPQELPVNATGKVLKTELSAIARDLLKGRSVLVA
ncbi:Nonribosomal peptide synthetases (NRPS) [Aspergillus tanneri]|uniref:Nonribosomal peptide synthetases (NRPS) n=1 Tax=Aspergillus tanneri TaxID=1220188 RepID=A0A5M9MM01_9EURO|nr:Nonribosomal peptide synthetases (NRPS) [Aspergillus tanneri]KAA8648041.1 Nonribosomal peptide synthetases (NRPS) [Aspergillus tanneri]